MLQGALLALQFGGHEAVGPLTAGCVVHHAVGLGQAHGSVVVLGAQHHGHAAGLARAHEHGGHTGFSQFQQNATGENGLCTVHHAPLYQFDGHGAPAHAGFVQGQGVAFGFHFQLGAVKQKHGHGVSPWASDVLSVVFGQ